MLTALTFTNHYMKIKKKIILLIFEEPQRLELPHLPSIEGLLGSLYLIHQSKKFSNAKKNKIVVELKLETDGKNGERGIENLKVVKD